ncbi:TIGR02587 family membrane protein [Geodermatophilus marinus]|uniref:TIGR02587 family membrane protein n=1 Tax=Geodermatophilus sp. LHW52908 TaxID=2303986 RepID=UPI000E3E561C|nr:TIGR02587 family membrane protein [Geodermatophilus sp. LHW52908]RFU20416.1 TIGR02587 family membrane protein [Geodermatophilus sp. LHW52908]
MAGTTDAGPGRPRVHEPDVGVSAGRATGGALLFALPLFMTMEVWQLGLSIPRYRLALLVAATVVLVVFLSRLFGAGATGLRRRDYLADAGVALVMAALVAAVAMTVFGVVVPWTDWPGALSVVAFAALPAAVGASFARSQLGAGSRRSETEAYGTEVLLMAAGAVVLAANIAPTEEIVLLAATAGPLLSAVVVVLSLLLMHGFVYRVGFKGQEVEGGPLRAFLLLTTVGYAVALAVSAYLLWTFGRFDGVDASVALARSVVLAVPASLGAAAARLVL